jgi:hypothetical protein
VPASAVLSVGGEPAVYVVNDAVAKLVRPKIGAKHFDEIVIEEGLSAGDDVIVSGSVGLKDGGKVLVSGT